MRGDRLFIDAVLFRAKTGLPWRDLPDRFGPCKTVYNRFARWAGLDIFYYLLPVAWAAWAQAQEDFDYDVVEVTDWALLFLPWVTAEKRVPVVVSMHGSCGQVDWFGKGEPRSLDGDWVRIVEAKALRKADVVHANSRANSEFWQEKTGREIRVIPPAYGGGTKADLTTEDTEVTETAVGPCLDKPSGALFSNPFTSELARDCENTSLTRFASGPAFRALREMKKLPRVGIQKKSGARPDCWDGGFFLKTSASLLARGFAKRLLHSRSE